MMANPRRSTIWLALLSCFLLLVGGVAACARLSQAGPGAAPLPTVGAAVQTAQPTAQVTLPTAQPTALPTALPTAQPTAEANDAFKDAVQLVSAMLDAHVAGGDLRPFLTGAARDTINGGRSIAYVLGLKPQPAQSYMIGQARALQNVDGIEVLAAINYDGYVSEFLFTVVWDGAPRVGSGVITRDGQADQYPQSAEELVTVMLNDAFRGGDVRPYLSQELADAISAGRSAYDLLGLRLADASGYSFGEPYSYPGADFSFLPVTINYDGAPEEQIFTVATNHSETPLRLKVYGSELAREGRPVATGPTEAANHFLLEIWADRSGRRALPYLFGELRERVARGDTVDLLAEGGVGPLEPLNSYQVGNVVAEDDTNKWVQISLDLGRQSGATRFAKVQQVDGFWRVVAVINSLAAEPPPVSEPPPAAYPGAGWTAAPSAIGRRPSYRLPQYGRPASRPYCLVASAACRLPLPLLPVARRAVTPRVT